MKDYRELALGMSFMTPGSLDRVSWGVCSSELWKSYNGSVDIYIQNDEHFLSNSGKG